MLDAGLTGIKETGSMVVGCADTAASVGSGELAVLATPVMIAWMEKTAAVSVKPHLPVSCTSVGTMIEVRHLSATPVGMTVRYESELVEIDRRRLVFRVSAYDDTGLIGEGKHERFIVDKEQFMVKANAKRGE